MAIKATIFKADLQISDMDRGYYAAHALTIARHPSETDARMMVRVLAFALYADEQLGFTRGLSDTDEPDLWRKDLTGAIDTWIEIGQPDERRILKACGRAAQVIVICYGGHSARIWWTGVAAKLERARNLRVLSIAPDRVEALAALAQRTMTLQCAVQDGQIWFSDADTTVEITLDVWKNNP